MSLFALSACGSEGQPTSPTFASQSLIEPRLIPAAGAPALRAAYVAAVQAEASSAYRIERSARGLRADNHAQRLQTLFTAQGVTVAPAQGAATWSWEVAPTRWGCEGALKELGPASLDARDNRVEYARPELREWYVNGPLGLEQGFTLPAPPRCQQQGGSGVVIALGDGALEVVISPGGDVASILDGTGRPVLRYTDLHVVDAGGRSLPATLTVGEEGLAIRIDDTGALYPIEVDPLIATEEAKLTVPGSASHGNSAAVDGDTAIVGAELSSAAALQGGAAFVFIRSGATWTLQQMLTASDAADWDYLGNSVALRGDTAIVGARDKGLGQGAAYVFVRSGAVWTEQQVLTASDEGDYAQFGGAVAVEGDTAIVGAPNKLVNQGAVYVFTRSGATWSQEQKITTGVAGDYLGASVAMRGDTAILGASAGGYAFVRSGVTWTEQQALIVSNLGLDWLGGAAALAGDTAIVGLTGNGPGEAHVFVRNGVTWTEQQALYPSNPMVLGGFGRSVALSGDMAIVGEPRNLGNVAGSAHVFFRSGAMWLEQPLLTASDGAASDRFGSSVALDGETAIVGATNGANPWGAAYAFLLKRSNGDPCISASSCVSGFCVDGVCCDTTCDAGACDACSMAAGAPANGTCTPLTGTPCDDGDGCTSNDACQGGTCVAGAPLVCTALNTCHEAGTCDPATGLCSNPMKANGVPCSDGDACTQNDTCEGGACTSGAPVTCSAVDVCHQAGTCDSATGLCSNPMKPEGTVCPGGVCAMGVCAPAETDGGAGSGGGSGGSGGGGAASSPDQTAGCSCRATSAGDSSSLPGFLGAALAAFALASYRMALRRTRRASVSCRPAGASTRPHASSNDTA